MLVCAVTNAPVNRARAAAADVGAEPNWFATPVEPDPPVKSNAVMVIVFPDAVEITLTEFVVFNRFWPLKFAFVI